MSAQTRASSPITAPPRAERRCHHCGDPCPSAPPLSGDKVFCCEGCRTVYELLAGRNLCAYYAIESAPGRPPIDPAHRRRYEFLDDEGITRQLVDFRDDDMTSVSFRVPSMHCASCIWLLERLPALRNGIVRARVDFPRKELSILFRHGTVALREIVALLASIGYEPRIDARSAAEKRRTATNRVLYARVGVAAFAFGNVMLLSFPEYLAGGGAVDPGLHAFFVSLNFLLSIPVLLFCAAEYFGGALLGLRARRLTIDVPVALGILALFTRSALDVLTGAGPGYFDSFTGLVFFLLVGKIFQKKSYDALSFDRDFRSYFPLSVAVRRGGRETAVPLAQLAVGDRMVVRNGELVPADAVLVRGEALIDYSFVTGESVPVPKRSGDRVLAGGRQCGPAVELAVVRDVSQSYLTRLWNDDAFSKPRRTGFTQLVDRVSGAFTAGVIFVAVAAALAWTAIDPSRVVSVFTAVLIVACPCALALSAPFALGTVQRVFGNHGFYLRNVDTVERLARVDAVVFDKTGTLTRSTGGSIRFVGAPLTDRERALVASLARHSTHALSRRLAAECGGEDAYAVCAFAEEAGRGLVAEVDGVRVRLGSAAWIGGEAHPRTAVSLAFDGVPRGRFEFDSAYRTGVAELVRALARRCALSVLSGDADAEEPALRRFFGDAPMRFRCAPDEKMRTVSALRESGRTVLAIGDGLNDAGALRAADVGVAIAEDVNAFSPACDAILAADRLGGFDRMLRFARAGVAVVKASFAISILYNAAGLAFAVSGLLSPLVSAVLMPASSVTVVAFTTLATRFAARRLGFRTGFAG